MHELRLLERFGKDLMYGARMLWRSPGFTAVAVISLALGIGANTAIFSLVDGLWTRPMAVPNPGQIVHLFSVTNQNSEGRWSFPEYEDLNQQSGPFQGVVARGGRGAQMPNPDGSLDLFLVNVVSTNFFSVLGVKPAAGRLFAPEDDSSLDEEPVVVLGNSFWKRRLGGDPSIVGRQILLSRGENIPFTVMGILPESFRETEPGSDRDLWLPPQSWVRLAGHGDFEQRGFRWFQVLGRLAPGASVEAALAQTQTVAARLAADWPATNAGRSAIVMTDFRYRLEAAGPSAIALLVIVLLLVLLCSVNVANLLLARGAARSREIGIRAALGAGRARLVFQLMTENLLLGLLGLAAGLMVGSGLITLLPHLMVKAPGFSVPLDFQLDQRVLLFALVVSVVTIALFGLTPAMRSLKPQLVPILKSGGNLADGRSLRLRLRHWLVIAQVSISLVLLVATGVLAASFANTRTADIGITRKPLLLVFLQYDPKAKSTYTQAIDQIKALPAVLDVAFALRAPLSLSGNGYAQKVTFPDHPEMSGNPPVEIKFNSVSSNYFQAMGTALRRGRGFNELDQTSGPPVAIINQRMADLYWPGEDAIDKLIHIEGDRSGDYRIVGMAQTSPINAIGEDPEPYIYLPFSRTSVSEITLLIQTQRDAIDLGPTVRHTLFSLSRSLDPLSITTQQALIRFSAGQYQTTAELVAALGFLGLILTAIGLYGVVSYGVDRRTREIGIRMALGAERNDTLILVLRESILMGGIGCVVGLPLALIATRLVRSLLFGISPWNSAVIAAAVVILALVLLAAGLVPAWRATRTDPILALRYE
jgi:predicted permease